MSELGKCPTCGGKISSAAVACPHCGEHRFYQAHHTREVVDKYGNNVTEYVRIDVRTGREDIFGRIFKENQTSGSGCLLIILVAGLIGLSYLMVWW